MKAIKKNYTVIINNPLGRKEVNKLIFLNTTLYCVLKNKNNPRSLMCHYSYAIRESTDKEINQELLNQGLIRKQIEDFTYEYEEEEFNNFYICPSSGSQLNFSGEVINDEDCREALNG